jgi:hypothetical protein
VHKTNSQFETAHNPLQLMLNAAPLAAYVRFVQLNPETNVGVVITLLTSLSAPNK